MRLSKRLAKVYELIPNSKIVADIGTDHGHLAVEIILNKKAYKVIASDVNAGPLASANDYVRRHNLADKIDCRLGSGLTTLKYEEAETVVICGMGGYLIKDILQESDYKPQNLIVQPQNGQVELRKYLVNNGYRVVNEELVEDMGHIYECWHWKYKDSIDEVDLFYDKLPQNAIEWRVGALLCLQGNVLFSKFMHWLISLEQKILSSIPDQNSAKYIEVDARCKLLEQCYAKYRK